MSDDREEPREIGEDRKLIARCERMMLMGYRREFGRLLMGKRSPNRNAVLLLGQIIWILFLAKFKRDRKDSGIVILEDGLAYVARARDEWDREDEAIDFAPRTVDRQLGILNEHSLIVKKVRPSARHRGALIPHVRPHSENVNALLEGRPIAVSTSQDSAHDNNYQQPQTLAKTVRVNPLAEPLFLPGTKTESVTVPTEKDASTLSNSRMDSPIVRESQESNIIHGKVEAPAGAGDGRPDDDSLSELISALVRLELDSQFARDAVTADAANCRQQLNSLLLVWLPSGKVKDVPAFLRAAIERRYPEPAQVKLIHDQEKADADRRAAYQQRAVQANERKAAREAVITQLRTIRDAMSDAEREELRTAAHEQVTPYLRKRGAGAPYEACLESETWKILAARRHIDLPEEPS